MSSGELLLAATNSSRACLVGQPAADIFCSAVGIGHGGNCFTPCGEMAHLLAGSEIGCRLDLYRQQVGQCIEVKVPLWSGGSIESSVSTSNTWGGTSSSTIRCNGSPGSVSTWTANVWAGW